MTLSRTSRILIAILLLAGAAFFWVNFFFADQVGATATTPAGAVAGGAVAGGDVVLAQATPVDPTVPVSPPGDTEGSESEASEDGTEPQTGENAQQQESAPTVVVPAAPEVVTRPFEVSDLPFLITAPPADDPQEVLETATELTRTQGSRRASVNPFSPILITLEEPQQADVPAPTAGQPEVTDVPVPGQPATAGATANGAAPEIRVVAAPTPRPLAPPAPRANGLPRSLPTGAPLGATPDLLRQTLTMPEIMPSELEQVAAVREPGRTAVGAPTPVGVTAQAVLDEEPVDVLGPAERMAGADPGAPMAAGVDPLSRYLRDNNVVFTGSVLGTVSVGVFRTADAQMPLVVSLGQTLPDTDIVLTDLTGLKAEFTLADSTEVLSLDLRR